MTLNDQGFYVCAKDEKDKIETSSMVEAYRELRCGDCFEREGCNGPAYRKPKKETQPLSRPGRKPKARTPEPPASPEESSAVEPKEPSTIQEPKTVPTLPAPTADNEAACRAALLGLSSRNTNLIQKRADEVAGKFQKEIATARGVGVGWKPISNTLKKYNFNVGETGIQKAFERLERRAAS